jgi:hypothetical protein
MGAKQRVELMQDPIPNPALKDLEMLVGQWSLEIDFPSDPPTTVRGHVSFDWLEGGAFLVMRSGVEWEGPSGSVAVIGRDDAAETYTMLYFDARGVSRIYQMSFGDGIWKQWRLAPGFSQRFTGTLSDDGATISARWEKSSNGAHWEHDFDLTYTRVT